MWHCEVCRQDIKNNTESSHMKFATHIKYEIIKRMSFNPTDKTYKYINPDFEQVDNLVTRAIDGCTKHFHRFKYKCVFVVKLNNATHGTTNFFIITKKIKINTKVAEAIELSHQIDEFEQVESGYTFHNIKTLAVKLFRYHDIKACSYCKKLKRYCNSKSIINIQNTENVSFLWPILAHKYKVGNHHGRLLRYAKHFLELNQGYIEFPTKIKAIQTFERLKNLNNNFFEL